MDPSQRLPYGPALTRMLEPMRRGFLVVNKYVTAPLIGSGLGPLLCTPFAGSLLVLRTTGRSSGLTRQAPLGYAVVDGRVVVMAGYGRQTKWFRNAQANPTVEIVLPGAVLGGLAEEVTDPTERREAMVTVLRAMGVVGRLTVGDIRSASPQRLDELAQAFPLLAITPTAVQPGPYDPGSRFTTISTAVSSLVTAALVTGLIRRIRRGR